MAGIREEIQARAEALGFSLVGVATAARSGHMERYRSWVEEGHHGEMAYLSREDAITRRSDLRLTMDGVASVIVVAHEYFQTDPEGVPADASRAVVARYARGEDYHRVVKRKLQSLLEWMDTRVEGGVRGRAYVDTGPILERDLGQRAGIGWFGKNTMLIHPGRGSYFFLGVLLVDVELPVDAPFSEDRCGTCRACLDACPTGALLGRDARGAPVMDARRCISYLTIELRGPIPRALRPAMGNRVFGCDICQEVCPWNERFAGEAAEPAYVSRRDLDGPDLLTLAGWLLDTDEEGFRERLKRSPVRRTGRAGFLRNVCVALGNWGDPNAVPVLTAALTDGDPLPRSHAAWALARIGTPEAVAALRDRLAVEQENLVRAELNAGLAEAASA